MSSTKDNSNQHDSLYMHGQPPPYDCDIEDYKAILLDEAEKLYTGLEKRIVDDVIDEHASKTSVAAASLPMLSYDYKQQGQNSSTPLDNS
ncbi:MAG TPA: hypothetical protein VFI70_01550 [Nitrososphaeraceae archaeon]|nr:hypothetical protein [Nitrososphaeraceae archaeon]